MNKFKKKTRSKMIAASIAILSSAAVVSTGFAAWVISGGETKEATGNITADTVTNNFHEITLKNATESVFFGGPAKKTQDENKSAWLTTANGSLPEDLDATFIFTVSGLDNENADPSAIFKSITLTETTDGTDLAKKYETYAENGNKKYLANLPTLDVANKKTYDTEKATSVGISLQKESFESKTQTFTLNIHFGWGSTFGHKNPFEHYNTLSKNSSNFSLANTALEDLSHINASFKLTIVTR